MQLSKFIPEIKIQPKSSDGIRFYSEAIKIINGIKKNYPDAKLNVRDWKEYYEEYDEEYKRASVIYYHNSMEIYIIPTPNTLPSIEGNYTYTVCKYHVNNSDRLNDEKGIFIPNEPINELIELINTMSPEDILNFNNVEGEDEDIDEIKIQPNIKIIEPKIGMVIKWEYYTTPVKIWLINHNNENIVIEHPDGSLGNFATITDFRNMQRTGELTIIK